MNHSKFDKISNSIKCNINASKDIVSINVQSEIQKSLGFF